MANLTRIKNNQITDSTILANTKIVPGSIVGSLFNSTMTISSDITITGNLTVQGSSTYLTVASTNTYVNDPLIVMNNAFSGTNTYDIGLLINRGDQTSTAMIWKEANKQFELTYTTDTGTTYGAINNSGYANLKVGNLTVATASSLGSLSVTGNITANYGTFVGDVLIAGGDLTANTTTFNLLNSTVTTLNAGGAATTIALGANSGTITIGNPTLVGTQTTQAVYNTTATTVNAFGAATALNVGAATGIATLNNANIWVPNATTIDGAQTTVNLLTQNATTISAFTKATTANVGATTGTFQINNPTLVGINTTQALYNTVATTMNFAGAATTLIMGAATGVANIRNATTNIIGAATVGSTLAVTGDTTLTGDLAVNGADITTSATTFNLLNATATTLNVGGAATTIAVGANSGTITIGNPTLVGTQTTQNVYNTTATTVNAFGAATTVGIGAASGTATINNATLSLPNATAVTVGQTSVAFANTTATTVNAFGAATTLNFAAATGTTTIRNNLSTGGNIAITSGQSSTSATTGALVVTGGVGLTGNIYVGTNAVIGGNLSVLGTTTYVNSTTMDVEDNIIELNTGANGAALSGSTINDVGIRAHYYNAGDKSMFFGRANDTGFFEIYSDATETSGNITGTYGTIKTGNVVLTGTTDTTSASSGALQVAGGVGIAKDLFVGGADIITDQTTFNLLNATATTLNVGGAATTIAVGANSGTITIGNPTIVGTQTTQNVYNTTATTVNAFGAATTLIMGAATGVANIRNATTNVIGSLTVGVDTTMTGDLAVNGADITTTASTFNLLNATATTLNVGGAATALNLGAATGIATLKNANIWAPNATTIDGAQTTVSLLTQNATTVSAFTNAATANIGAGTGTMTINNPTLVGQQATQNLYNTLATTMNFAGAATSVITGAATGTFNIRNANLYLPNATTIYSGQATFTIANVNVTSLNIGGAATTVGIGAATGTATINNATTNILGNATVSAATASTSASTGALKVTGGAGFAKNVYVANGATINSTQSAESFLVKGISSTALIYASTATDSVVIGGGHYGGSGGNTTVQGGVTLKIDATDTMMVPVGTTAQRPSNSGNVDVTGMTRYNSTINNLEFYDGTVWQSAGSVFTIISDRQFSGATGGLYGNVDGANTTFTIQSESTTAATIVSINGVIQIPVLAYDVSLAVLTFTEAPALGDVIDVRCLATTTVLKQLASGNGLNQYIVDNNGAQIWSGTSSTIQRVNVDTGGTIQLMNGTGMAYDETAISVTTSATTIDSFPVATYRGAKYLITFTNGTTSYEITEIIVVHNGTTATRTQYGTISTSGTTLGTYTATISSGNVLIQCAAVSGTGTVKAFATYIKV